MDVFDDAFKGDFIRLGEIELGEGVVLDKNVKVAMRDGVRLACDVYRPAAEGQYPVLFATSRYLKDTVYLETLPSRRWRETGDIAGWVRRGYVYVLGDTRGSGQSEGQYGFFDETEQTDLYDMIEWAGVQSWSNGRVGMIGESYFAMVQWAAALQNPPHLKCIAPYDGCTDLYRDLIYKGGIFYNAFSDFWHNDTRGRHFLHYPARGGRADYFETDFPRIQFLHPWFDEFWEVRRFDPARITIPVFSIGNWGGHNAHLRSNLMAFELLRGPKKLMVNTQPAQDIFHTPLIEEPLARWYDHWLKGIDNGVMDEPPVRIAIRGGKGYRDEPEWPLTRAKVRKIYLAPGPSNAVESLNDGALTWSAPTGKVAPTTYTYPDPEWSNPNLGSGTVRGRTGLPHNTRKILTFTSPPMEEDMEVTGPVAMVLFASSTEPDTQFVVQIMDQPPLSDEMANAIRLLDVAPPAPRVTMGWLKATHRDLDPALSSELRPWHTHTKPQPLESGRIYRYDIEIWPTCWVFKAGHRIRLEITATDGLYFLGHMQSTDSIHHDAEHPSHVLLPVIPKEA